MPIGGHALSSAPIGATAGSTAVVGVVNAQLDFSGSSATGSTPLVFVGDASGSFSFAASASGAFGPGAQVYTFLRFTASATGDVPLCGAIDATFPISGAAIGVGHVQGSIAATVGFSAVVTSIMATLGDVYYDEGIFSCAAGGFVSTMGEISGALSFTASATGLATAGGGAAGALSFSAAATGSRGVAGSVSAVFPFVPSITGGHGRLGAASASVKFSGAAFGASGVQGAVAAAVPFSASATGHANEYPVGAMYAVLGIAAYAYGLGQPEEVDVCA